jgi:hypothetical protein
MRNQWTFMTRIRFLSALVLLIATLCPASAADPIFPPGIRVGLTPLVGLAPAKTFLGFETEDHSVKVLVAELPAAAYAEVSNTFKAANNVPGPKPESIETAAGTAYYTIEDATDGRTKVRRYSMILPGTTFAGYVAAQVPEDASKIYTDDAVRKMFASAAIRKQVPVEEQLAQMPFKITDIADFKNVRTLAIGSTIVLADGDESTGFEAAPFMVISLLAQSPASPDDRERFAQEAIRSFPGIRESRLTVSEPLRVDGAPGYETRIDATSGKDNTKVTVVQWLKFSGASVLRIVGSSPRDQWEKAFPRFRAVRDGLQQRG